MRVFSSFFFALLMWTASREASALSWNPESIDWVCATNASGNYVCSLVAEGALPPNLNAPITASADYRVLKGRTLGQGPILLTSKAQLACSVRDGNRLRCIAADEVALAAGVFPAFGFSPPSTLLNIYVNQPTLLFDWDGDSRLSADKEGLILLRFMLGFRGVPLLAGITNTDPLTVSRIEQAVSMGVRNGWFDFLGDGKVLVALQEGVVALRCLNGLRGNALVAQMNAGDNSLAATAKCEQLIRVE